MAIDFSKLINCHPSISRGIVWCHKCGKQKKVDPEHCFKNGWPICCNLTMSIDSPEERKNFKKE